MCRPRISDSLHEPAYTRQRGFSLIEVIVFMTIVAVAAGGILSVFAKANKGSSEMLARRQAMTIAEAVLNEVVAAPFTWCDPADTKFLTATSTASCNSMPEVLPGAPEAGETRLGASKFDNVNDFNAFAMGPGITDRAGTVVTGTGSYSVRVSTAAVAAAASWNGMTSNDMAVVTVSVTSPLLGDAVALQGLRARYAPRRAAP